jgi:hypothetical protein
VPGSEFPKVWSFSFSRKRVLGIVCLALFVYGSVDAYLHREFKQLDGVLAPLDPVQSEVKRPPIKYKGHILEFLASYQLQARILSVENYYTDRGAKLSPVDLGLGWGPMSDNRNLRILKVSQGNRFYFYGWDDAPPLPEDIMRTHSANVHIVPSDKFIEKQIKALRKGQIVQLRGYLIMVSDFEGGSWKSSLTREDSGPGACELFYVESVM